MPRKVYKPMLVTPAKKPPIGDEWVYELKFDGYRMMGYVEGERAQLISRGGADYTKIFPKVAQALPQAVGFKKCVVDGELIALDSQGHPSLSLLQQRRGKNAYYLFDLLEINHKPVLDKTLLKRRKLLEGLYQTNRIVLLSQFFLDAFALMREVQKRKLEGVVAKRKDSHYRPGKRSPSWKKIKFSYAAK